MNCDNARNHMQLYLEGRLAGLERNEFVHHVTECASCEREVLEYREVFRSLRELPRVEAPSRISIAVMAHLTAENVVHEPRFPRLSRAADTFLGLPARVRYPLAAFVAVVLLYAPVALILTGSRGSIAGTTETFARAVLWLQGSLNGITTLASLEPYTRALRTVAHATSALVSPGAFILGVALMAALIVTASYVLRRKRSSRHAMFSF